MKRQRCDVGQHHNYPPVRANTNPLGSGSRINTLLSLERDNHICQFCGAKGNLLVHHLDLNGPHKCVNPNNNIDNLVTLCYRCHMCLHYGTSERDKDILNRRNGGETLQAIANSYNVSRQRIFQILQKIGRNRLPHSFERGLDKL